MHSLTASASAAVSAASGLGLSASASASAAQQAQPPEWLARILLDLRSRSEEIRLRGANELRSRVSSASREFSGDAFNKYINDINRRIFELLQSADINEKLGGIVAIDRLVDVDGEEANTKVERFANYLRPLVLNADHQVMNAAIRALGRLTSTGAANISEFVEKETRRAFEWLSGDRNEHKRQAATLIVKEFASHSPALFLNYINQSLDLIWSALRDNKLNIRDSAAEALAAILQLISQREATPRNQWFTRIFDEAMKGLKQSNADTIQGSLLALREMLSLSGNFLQDRYLEIDDKIYAFKDHREALVRRTVISMVPNLAAFCLDPFINHNLNRWMSHLLGQMKKEKERAYAFISVGKLAIVIRSSIGNFLEAIIQNIKDILTVKVKGRVALKEEFTAVFECISMLVQAVGMALTKHMHELLDPLFNTGLSESFRQTLLDLARHAPPLLSSIQERLINTISVILSGQAYRSQIAPRITVTSNASVPASAIDQRDPDLIVLALEMLGQFDFSGYDLNDFILDVVVIYLEDDSIPVRVAAAWTCCNLLSKDSSHYFRVHRARARSISGPAGVPVPASVLVGAMTQSTLISERSEAAAQIQTVGRIVEKLLTAGVADPEPSIRSIVLSSLDSRFDNHLAQPENVRSLFIALNDENFTVRELAISIIGRLTFQNPAYIMPNLRKTLVQLLTELQYSASSRDKEESARLLALMIAGAKDFVKPYMDSILRVLRPKLKDSNAGVVTQALLAMNEIATIGGREMTTYLDDTIPLIIDALQDQSSAPKKEAALCALASICSSTGYVIEPYMKYPNLLENILSNLRAEQHQGIRLQTTKLLGILGPLDPYKHRSAFDYSEKVIVNTSETNTHLEVGILSNTTTASEDYYPRVAFLALIKILRDPSLSVHHATAINAVMYMFKNLGLKCVGFLPQIIPPFLNMIRSSASGALEFYFGQLAVLVKIVKQAIREHVSSIFALLQEFWSHPTNVQIAMIALVETVAIAFQNEFKIYLPEILPQILTLCESDMTDRRVCSQRVLQAINIFGANLEEYLNLVIPSLVRLIERPDMPVAIKKLALKTLGHLCRKIDFADNASRVIHPLVRALAIPDLRVSSTETLCILVFQLSSDYAIFVPMVNKALLKHRITYPRYDLLVSKLLKNEPLPMEENQDNDETKAQDTPPEEPEAPRRLPVNQNNLKKGWNSDQKMAREDWVEWMRRFSVELLRESPSHALRACAQLAAAYYPLARELFNAAFVSCWSELYDQFQDELIVSLKRALTSPTLPTEILQTILNLAEFMEHDEKELPISIDLLGQYAVKCQAYAKALHYKELEYHSHPSTDTIESLLSLNNQLQQPEAAVGLLKYGMEHHKVELKENWYEKLGRWEDALAAYQLRLDSDPTSVDLALGRMRCLHALGQWEALNQQAQETWGKVSTDIRKVIAPMAAAAAWGLERWDAMSTFTAMMDQTSDGHFLRAVLLVHRNFFKQAKECISAAQSILVNELVALVGESYNRAYNVLVKIEMLTSLDEIIVYKQSYSDPERQSTIRQMWMARLKGSHRHLDLWQRVLKVRSLVLNPIEHAEAWIKFANLARKSGRKDLAEKTLVEVLKSPLRSNEHEKIFKADPSLIYSHLKFMWAFGDEADRNASVQIMQVFASQLASKISYVPEQGKFVWTIDGCQILDGNIEKTEQLLARCHRKLGQWHMSSASKLSQDVIPQMLNAFEAATRFDRNWYKGWHAWALANFEVVSHYEKMPNIPDDIFKTHVIASVQGFFRSISLSSGNVLQETLRLLTLWFKYGDNVDVNAAIGDGFNNIAVDTWLMVIPQLIARIHVNNHLVRKLIYQLLTEVGKEHPQALIYPLTVTAKSDSPSRKLAAQPILDKLRQHSPLLVDQALLVSDELIRVAVLWHERWNQALEEASRGYFTDKSAQAMLATLEPLHALLDKGPETLHEISFNQEFGRYFREAGEWIARYKVTKNQQNLNQAWELYYQAFKKFTEQVPELKVLKLQYVSPKLYAASDLQLAVPGTYRSGEPTVRISSFDPTLQVISSKQRPRKLCVKGSDGRDYQYLLKGHEDLRQDERVMQLFSLVNTLLATDPETLRRHLNIIRYSVTPLSTFSGLIGWVPHCDTMHALIKDYRESRKVALSEEHKIMIGMAPQKSKGNPYDQLMVIQKLEVFQYALNKTDGLDLHKILWLTSRHSEAWLDRRTNYTRSLAVMSMVGYILGLGDRHPSNLMLDRVSGNIIHIDFGDCFEVAMNRDKFPEKVPFRLTRMLVLAMEVSGIEGNYRTTCEQVMRVMRENKDSLMAILEAFVYDPLINWRLLNAGPSPKSDRTEKSEDEKIFRDPTDEQHVNYRRLQRNESELISMEEDTVKKPEVLNKRAILVIQRISNKLTGRDFKPEITLDVREQVEKLIKMATSRENLCQSYIGCVNNCQLLGVIFKFTYFKKK